MRDRDDGEGCGEGKRRFLGHSSFYYAGNPYVYIFGYGAKKSGQMRGRACHLL